MRVVQNEQMTIGEIDIARISFDSKSRDDIPKILKGLQFVYTNVALRTAIFQLLERQVAPRVSKTNGRPGMTLWTILVCGVIRLDLNCDYDRLHKLVNEHNTLRQMLGHGAFEDVSYHFQTLKDNVSLLTPELLGEINELIVRAGHVLVKKKDGEALRGRCNSFVLETHVHYPSDINVLWDAMRKTINVGVVRRAAHAAQRPSIAACPRRTGFQIVQVANGTARRVAAAMNWSLRRSVGRISCETNNLDCESRQVWLTYSLRTTVPWAMAHRFSTPSCTEETSTKHTAWRLPTLFASARAIRWEPSAGLT